MDELDRVELDTNEYYRTLRDGPDARISGHIQYMMDHCMDIINVLDTEEVLLRESELVDLEQQLAYISSYIQDSVKER